MVERFLGQGTPAAPPPTSPVEVLETLANEAEAGREPSAALLDSIDELDIPPEVVWDAGPAPRLPRLLRTGDRGAASLEILDRLDVLARFVPEWVGRAMPSAA